MLSDALLSYAKKLGFGELFFKIDEIHQLCAIVAIHSTRLGPALGGCRFIEYTSINLAICDALRLAQGMSYKAALANLPLGGGKTVLMRPQSISDRTAYFRSLGRFVNELKGRYIIAMDSGVVIEDMDSIALETPYVVTTSKHKGNPAPYTALSVLYGIEAAVKFKLHRDNLEGIHIAIQGVGHVGFALANALQKKGARLTICDNNTSLIERYAKDLRATLVDPNDIYAVHCDVFSPCALGGILNDEVIAKLNTAIVAGAANNQLAEPRHADLLHKKNILYAPDYVINSGGLIYAYAEYQNRLNREHVAQQIRTIYSTLLGIFKCADEENKLPSEVADRLAEARLNQL
ncbi:Glu/Leu/Phe/Val dehydrogenase family protein [Rickettsiella grylli]|uniref:Glu/Leu/Phe/Val dehydrogenase n=1 Tax=Rickettsiella grylli TaxID=59196 RepID=A8PL06_9COXI|nr:Glu/Leu/Phe/Val dehydrogenase family protein [Rickettsiella grylli]EDP46026.1 Glu/Leu/Phe/Val dehydrogenase [Rickettsiella grylli]